MIGALNKNDYDVILSMQFYSYHVLFIGLYQSDIFNFIIKLVIYFILVFYYYFLY